MIRMHNWEVTLPNPRDRRIGFSGEHRARKLEIAVDNVGDWTYKLDLRSAAGTANILALTAADGLLSADLERTHVAVSGLCQAQVRGLDGEREKKSNVFYLEIGAAICATDTFAPLPPSEFAQMEQQMTALSAQAGQAAADAAQARDAAQQAAGRAEDAVVHAPRIERDTWWVYDPQTASYQDTGTDARGLRGPQGEKGEPGERGAPGADGTSFVIGARYETLDAMLAAHPTGRPGEAYAVGSAEDNVIYNWSAVLGQWQPLGRLQGPRGEAGAPGVPGDQGEKGDRGEKGDKGDPGAPGADGQSAYEAAVAGGFAGSAQQFGALLAGLSETLGKPRYVPVTLPAAGWSGEPASQTVPCTGATADVSASRLTILPDWADREGVEDWIASRVLATAQGADSITFTALAAAPARDLKLSVEVQPL